jgi:hypothetical protein
MHQQEPPFKTHPKSFETHSKDWGEKGGREITREREREREGCQRGCTFVINDLVAVLFSSGSDYAIDVGVVLLIPLRNPS